MDSNLIIIIIVAIVVLICICLVIGGGTIFFFNNQRASPPTPPAIIPVTPVQVTPLIPPSNPPITTPENIPTPTPEFSPVPNNPLPPSNPTPSNPFPTPESEIPGFSPIPLIPIPSPTPPSPPVTRPPGMGEPNQPEQPEQPPCPDNYDYDGGLFCYEKCPANWPAGSTITLCQHDAIYSTVGADASLSIPNVCEPNKVNYAGLCYELPNDNWYVSSPGIIAEKCPEGTNFTGTTCAYDRGVGTIPGCPPGYDDDGVALCYKQYDNWPGTQTLTHLQHATIYSPAKPLSDCPSDTDKIGALCYEKCDTANGYVRTALGCKKPCPEGFRDDGLYCAKNTVKATCPPGKTEYAGLCYEVPQNYEIKSPGILGPVCSDGTFWNGTSCY